MGTVGYMSPEQVRGRWPITARIFSVSARLCTKCSRGSARFAAYSVETMNAILKLDPPELTEPNRTVPLALARSCGTAWRRIRGTGFSRRGMWGWRWGRCPIRATRRQPQSQWVPGGRGGPGRESPPNWRCLVLR